MVEFQNEIKKKNSFSVTNAIRSNNDINLNLIQSLFESYNHEQICSHQMIVLLLK